MSVNEKKKISVGVQQREECIDVHASQELQLKVQFTHIQMNYFKLISPQRAAKAADLLRCGLLSYRSTRWETKETGPLQTAVI